MPRAQLDYASDYTSDARIDPARTALVIVDMQYASASRTEGQGRLLEKEGRPEIGKERFDRIEQVVLPNLRRLLDHFRTGGLPVLHVASAATRPDYMDVAPHLREMARARGNLRGTRVAEILDELKPLAEELVFWKSTVSGFNSTGIEVGLHSLGIRSVLFTGVSTNQCVGLSAFDAADRGFQAVMVEDCCAATKMEYHDAALINHQRFLGRVMSSGGVIEELQAAPASART
jgi:biuret amidohydrolase